MNQTGSITLKKLYYNRLMEGACADIKLKSIKGKMLNSIQCIFSNMLFGTKSSKSLKYTN